VRARPRRVSVFSVSRSKSALYGAFAWARRALNSPKRRFPARAVVVANGAEQSPQRFTLQLGGSFPANSTWWAMRVVRMFDADYAITVSPNGTFTDCPGHPGAVQRP
jgi:hypothetical protein